MPAVAVGELEGTRPLPGGEMTGFNAAVVAVVVLTLLAASCFSCKLNGANAATAPALLGTCLVGDYVQKKINYGLPDATGEQNSLHQNLNNRDRRVDSRGAL